MKSLTGTIFVAFLLAGAWGHAETFDSNGTEIRYSVSGSGQPVVLLHGFIGSSEEWTSPPPFLPPSQQRNFETIAESLSKDFKVVVLDCRGHGKSGKPTDQDQYGLEMVEDIVRLLDHLKIEQAHVVGYSMGASLSAKLLTAHPDRVKSVVLGGGGALHAGSEQLAFMLSIGQSLESGNGVAPLIVALTPPGQPMPTPEQIAQNNKMFLANQDENALAKVALGHEQWTVSEAKLRSNKVPALLIVGGNDPLKTSSEATKKLLTNSRLVVLEGHDHISTEMSPDFLNSVRQFLKEN